MDGVVNFRSTATIAVMDNQGSCLVFEPSPAFKRLAMNRLETMLPRDPPIPPQETIADGPTDRTLPSANVRPGTRPVPS
jgi:hypothetical protein